jgi:hypothetical protein
MRESPHVVTGASLRHTAKGHSSPRDAQPDVILVAWVDLVHLRDSHARNAEYLREEGYTHVLLNGWSLESVMGEEELPLPLEDVERLRELVEHQIQPAATIDQCYESELRD